MSASNKEISVANPKMEGMTEVMSNMARFRVQLIFWKGRPNFLGFNVQMWWSFFNQAALEGKMDSSGMQGCGCFKARDKW